MTCEQYILGGILHTDIRNRALRTSSKPSHKLFSTPSTATLSQVGEHTSTSSRRTRSPRDCSRVDRIKQHRSRCGSHRGRQSYARILYNKEGIGIADGAQELKGRHHMRGCHVTSFLGSHHEIHGPDHGFSTFSRQHSLSLDLCCNPHLYLQF